MVILRFCIKWKIFCKGSIFIVDFPLHREYPIPNIVNEKKFRQRFREVFDKTLIDKIINSEINQWSEVDWKGIMLKDGIVWINCDEGKIIAVNYQSEFEKKLRKDLIVKEKENVHMSLKDFESPAYKIKTKSYLIRVDKLSNGKYRYASWKIDERESLKPGIILNNGDLEFDGSVGNHIITFINGNYTYKIWWCSKKYALFLNISKIDIKERGQVNFLGSSCIFAEKKG